MKTASTGRQPGLSTLVLAICVATSPMALAMPAAAARQGMEERLIVKFKESKDAGRAEQRARAERHVAESAARRGVQLKVLRELATGGRVLRVEGRRGEARELARLIRESKDIEYVEEDRILRHYATPNDPQYASQWHYFETTGGLRLPAAWDQATGSGVRVAVLDTGYRPHADLAANIVGGYDMIADTFVSNDGNGRDSDASDPGDWATAGQCGSGEPASDSSWHGTHVAGTVAAVTNNGSGVAGVAYGAKVVPVRVLGRCGGYTSDIADAIIWAAGGTVSGVPANANPAKVISLSLGGGGSCDATSQAAIDTARSLGAVVIVAAGNENQNVSNSSPANCSGVVAVAATNRAGGRAYYSNYGTLVDVAAPGGAQSFANDPEGILSTLNAGTQGPGADSYAYFQGTSMATPHVSGVAALMFQKKSTATPDEIESTLKSTARAFPATCSGCGTGIVDANAAVTAIGGTTPPPSNVLVDGVAVTGLAGSSGTELRYTISVPSGQSTLTFTQSGGSGDADLYVRFGSAPTTSSYDCRPYKSGNAETCSFNSPAAGTWHVMVRGYSTFSGVSLMGDHAAAPASSCAAGYTESKGSLSAGGSGYAPTSSGYASSVSGTHSGRLTGPAGTDFDLYLQKRASNGSWSSVKSGTGSTSVESVDYAGTSGTYRWRVHAYSGSGSYTLCYKKP
jgi:serine protease